MDINDIVDDSAQTIYESCDDITKQVIDELVDEGMILSEALSEVGMFMYMYM